MRAFFQWRKSKPEIRQAMLVMDLHGNLQGHMPFAQLGDLRMVTSVPAVE
jgi:hypothetical protein